MFDFEKEVIDLMREGITREEAEVIVEDRHFAEDMRRDEELEAEHYEEMYQEYMLQFNY